MKTLITYDARDGNTYSVPCNDEKKSFIKELLWNLYSDENNNPVYIVYINNKEYTLDLKNNKIIPKEYNFYKYTGSLINDPDSTSYRWYCDIRCGFTFDPFMNPTGNDKIKALKDFNIQYKNRIDKIKKHIDDLIDSMIDIYYTKLDIFSDNMFNIIKDKTDKKQLRSALEYHFRHYIRNDTDPESCIDTKMENIFIKLTLDKIPELNGIEEMELLNLFFNPIRQTLKDKLIKYIDVWLA